MKTHLQNFISGFLSTLTFHQGSIALLHAAGTFPNPAYNLAPTAPFGVPAVISLSFFGGLWGMLIAWMLRKEMGRAFWIKMFLYGAIGPTAVALLIILPLKGLPFKPVMVPFGLLLNGIWGLGLGVFTKLFSQARKPVTIQ